MSIPRWKPPLQCTRQEQFVMKRLVRTGKLFRFLREHRHEIFDDAFQDELASMYRSTGAGRPPVAPALLAMVVLLQAYQGISDAEAVELSVVDLRWQMVLNCLGQQQPAFSQGTLVDFRARLIGRDLDRRLLERTVEFAKASKAFDPKKLPTHLRIAVDSSPLEGAGRVEDTINLLGHAARKVLECAAALLQQPIERVAQEAGAPMLVAPSIKRALDIQWSVPAEKAGAIRTVIAQIDALEHWIQQHLPEQMKQPPLADDLATLKHIRSQDLEPDPDGGGGPRIRDGVAEDRRISISDPDMRHGRKSKSKRFNGYKRHLAADLDTDLILSCAITPANKPEESATPAIQKDLERYGITIAELHVDRGYIGSSMVTDVTRRRGLVLCKPWVPHNGGHFTKSDFSINVQRLTVTCPGGLTEPIRPGSTVEFSPEACARCKLRRLCTMATRGAGRTLSIAEDECLQQHLQKIIATRSGRERLRERVAVEHRLAHVGRKQGARARYRGARKNLFDTRRNAAVVNLETAHRAEMRMAA